MVNGMKMMGRNQRKGKRGEWHENDGYLMGEKWEGNLM
jgi:hypothetical protein